MTTYRVKNWRKFQHYKDRNPPWIKLHWELLSSMDWVVLNDASRVLAVACMLIASRNDGEIRGDETGIKYLLRVAHLNSKPDFNPLIACGLLEYASTMLAPCKQESIPETYKDSTEKLSETTLRGKPRELDGFSRFWKAWPASSRKGGKSECLRRWAKDGLETRTAEIVKHVEALKGGKQWADPQFIPAPLVYLNQARWDGAEVADDPFKGVICG